MSWVDYINIPRFLLGFVYSIQCWAIYGFGRPKTVDELIADGIGFLIMALAFKDRK